MITILGATATGKTKLAVNLAYSINGEIISADSRQVYRGMNIGTGKDLKEYALNGKNIPYHLIDILEAGYEYNVYEYVKDFHKAYNSILNRNKIPVLCGGSGMYIEAILKGYKLNDAPVNKKIRENLSKKTDTELIEILTKNSSLHNTTDTKNRNRLIRAIEISLENSLSQTDKNYKYQKTKSTLFGIYFEREIIRKRITERLKKRLDAGMIEEVKELMDKGLSYEKLKYYGLEYKFVSQYLLGKLNYNDMYQKLNFAIHHFAKRQMTWFRKMEKDGFEIIWIDGNMSYKEKVKIICNRSHLKILASV
jgi:tRNA dimethylallyltransferase